MASVKSVDTDLLNIIYFEAGVEAAEVILLLHGWPDDATTWQQVIPSLADERFRVIAPFLRGFGDTRFLNDTIARTGNSGRLAMDIISFMDALGIQSFNVVGHDWGSNIAEALAVGWPDRVKRMILLSTPPRLGGMPTPPFEHAQLEWYHWFMATKRGAKKVAEEPIDFAKIMWNNWSPKGWYDEETFSQVSESFKNSDFVSITLHSYRSRWDEAEPDPTSVWLEEKIKSTKTLSLPAIFIQGEEDGVNPPRVSENVKEKFTGYFERTIFPGVGHFPSREQPDRVADAIKQLMTVAV